MKNEALGNHLPTIMVVTALGLATGAFAFMQIRNSVDVMSADTFSTLTFAIPCVLMLVCSIAVTITARQIGRWLYLTTLGICMVCGLLSMVVTSGWMEDATVAQALLANSPDDTQLVPVLQAPFAIIRNITAFLVIPTVGSIAGAWLGSRLHPLAKA